MILLLAPLTGAGVGLVAALVRVTPDASAPAAAATSATQLRGPGIEPPADGEWPADWPRFSTGDATVAQNLAGVGFSFRVPDSWTCRSTPNAEGVAHYVCGPTGDGPRVGGDVIVRDCPNPCDANQRIRLRQSEDAWGLQWTRAGTYVAWAQTTLLPGGSSYGLVVVGFWRSVANGPVDRMVVLRLTATPERARDIQAVANEVYHAI